MTSREQARITADALPASARAKREQNAFRRTRSLSWFYPALKPVPAMSRRSVLSGAKQAANTHWSSLLLLGLASMAFLPLIGFDVVDRADAARNSAWTAAVLFIAVRLLEQIHIRRYLSGS
jgi:hypothetical protein